MKTQAQSIEELEAQLEAAKAERDRQQKEGREKEQQALLARRNELRDSAQKLITFSIREAQQGNLADSKEYAELARKAELEANLIVLDGENEPIKADTFEDDLDDFRQESSSKNAWYFGLITLVISFLYLKLGLFLKENYPDAGIHDLVTMHKVLSVVVFLFVIELVLMLIGSIRDSFLSRYGNPKKYLFLDIVKDFHNSSPNTRLWLRFSYFALRFFAACLLASGNLI